MKKSIGIILMVLLFLSMATGLGIAIGALIATADEVESNAPYIKDGTWWIGDTDTGIVAEGKTPTIEIIDGYWYIDGENTGVKAQGGNGQNGEAPVIEIIDGYWYIGGVNTGVKAEGKQGPDGSSHTIEIIDGYWYIDGENTGVKAEGENGQNGETPVFGVKVEDGWVYMQNEDGEYEAIWNLEYGVDNPTDVAKLFVEEKVAELEALITEDSSDAVKDIVNSAIEELQNMNTAGVNSIDKLNELVEEANELVDNVNSDVEEQLAKEITITINLDSEQVDQYIAEKGNVVTEPSYPAKEGYTLKWYSDGAEFDFTTIVNDDLVLDGVYEANTYSIKYVVDGQQLNETSDYKYGEDAVVDIETPEKEGYKFNVWVDANDVAYETKPMPIDGITLYATWIANTYKVDYNLGYETEDLEDLEVTYNAQYQLTSPEREGYRFVGWYYNGELVETQGDAWLIANNVVLVAEWEGFKLNQTVNADKVTFDVTAVDVGQIENTNTIEIKLKVKTSEVSGLTGSSLIQDSKELSVKSSEDGEYTIYVITFYAEEELTAENNSFAELTVTLASGVESTTLEVVAVNVNGSGEYLGAYDVEYNNSIVIERSL